MEEVVLLTGLRSPIGKYRGALKDLTSVELGVHIATSLLNKFPESKKYIGEVIFGNVLQAGSGQNVARQIAVKSGLDLKIPAYTVNEVCASGLKAILLGKEAIQLGKAKVVLAGGVESMTQAPTLKKTDGTEVKSLFYDGLTDAFSNAPMGLTAEKVAEMYGISRKEQDEFAYLSQKKAAKAWAENKFSKELAPMKELQIDEGIRKETTLEKLATLEPVFKENGTVTAGNASTINDGAAGVLLCSKSFAEEMNWPYLAILKESVEIGFDPSIMGISPIVVIQELLEKSKLTKEEIDIFEINEAFAATSLVVEKKLGLDPEKVNPLGGGISLGHAIGATGSRLTTTLAHQLNNENKHYGIAALCVGGGLGVGVLLEHPVKKKPGKFYEWSVEERQNWISEQRALSQETISEMKKTSLPKEVLNQLSENTISEVEIPLGLVKDVQLNGKNYIVPLATEEPSVVAACNYGAKMAGNFTSHFSERLLNGQIVFAKVKDPQLKEKIAQLEEEIFTVAKKTYPSIYKRGGGLRKIKLRAIENFLSVDLYMDTKDAMGANMMNSILEGVGDFLAEKFPQEKIILQILSNEAQHAMVSVSCEFPVKNVGGKEVAEKIAEASYYASLDEKRAVTHNKGIENGTSALLLATGNDTRQGSSSMHAYASHTGKYLPLSTWTVIGDTLKGEINFPLTLGIVGGGTKVLPKAKLSLDILKVETSRELADLVGAVGLAQNLAALKALVTTGIQKGHMKLQARSLAMSVGATEKEVPLVVKELLKGNFNEEKAKNILNQIRK